MNIGDIIKKARKEKNMTMRQLIGRLKNPISMTYICNIEIHDEVPSPELLLDISRVLDLNYDELSIYAQEKKLEQFKEILDKKYR